MNTADIEAARRLIAQFEGNALGRHNSNQWNRPGQEAPEQRWRDVHPKHNPQECEIGDYCWSLGFDVPTDQLIATVLKRGVNRFLSFKSTSPLETIAMEFERVRVIVNRNRGRSLPQAWRRVA